MGKEIEVCPYNEILFHNLKKWTVDALSNMDELKNNYAEWKKAEKSTNFLLHLYNILGRNAIKSMTERRQVFVSNKYFKGCEQEHQSTRKFSGRWIYLLSWLWCWFHGYIYLKTYQNVHFMYVQFIVFQLNYNKTVKMEYWHTSLIWLVSLTYLSIVLMET